ncbi:hypothetical protein [Mycolicibacterium fluoranthenivorans]|uniref:Uncharacterized protein n=1 Tax=Mycolicibacterium fluoranthenivorans TaxID=258505 RepID=A0A7X5ZE08_9MYCO|nr:hypothetical protein [Mycolicibacterium fluoranthenivorans]MCV7354800.1 hypothetical protein [Mycolicibacterium fluoranthenivorans]NIH96613.1 hypothetical protein [Mycolicibacterium fluoranthenivorans]
MNHSTSAAADPHLQGAGEHCATILADDELRRRIRDTAIGQIGAQGVPLSWQALATTTGLSRDVLVRLIGSPDILLRSCDDHLVESLRVAGSQRMRRDGPATLLAALTAIGLGAPLSL